MKAIRSSTHIRITLTTYEKGKRDTMSPNRPNTNTQPKKLDSENMKRNSSQSPNREICPKKISSLLSRAVSEIYEGDKPFPCTQKRTNVADDEKVIRYQVYSLR